jgi:hypothetical protein
MADFESYNHNEHNKKSRKLTIIGISLAIIIGIISIGYTTWSSYCIENNLINYLEKSYYEQNWAESIILCEIKNPESECKLVYEQVYYENNPICFHEPEYRLYPNVKVVNTISSNEN